MAENARTETSAKSPYVSIAQLGNCKICAEYDDLRFGVCFDCADHVGGEKISATTHRLWDTRNRANEWFASEDHN